MLDIISIQLEHEDCFIIKHLVLETLFVSVYENHLKQEKLMTATILLPYKNPGYLK